jgi:hypothetical protein
MASSEAVVTRPSRVSQLSLRHSLSFRAPDRHGPAYGCTGASRSRQHERMRDSSGKRVIVSLSSDRSDTWRGFGYTGLQLGEELLECGLVGAHERVRIGRSFEGVKQLGRRGMGWW